MTRVSGEWLTDPGTQAICKVLAQAGHRILFVGGCVRNALLGVDVNDTDLTTDATPETVTKLAVKAGMKVVPTGIDHGTVTVVVDRVPHEITTFRRDVETDGRRAVVAYTTDVREDALRRDFTMNALYAEPDGTLVDPLGGLGDLRARHVRFIEDADARIREDYLRILRFFRFHAWYGHAGDGLDADGLAACAANSAGLETLSKERVGAELLKLLSAPNPAPAVAGMQQAGCLTRILPGADAKALPIVVHFEKDAEPDPIRRLAALGGQDVVQNLRLSRGNARRLDLIRQFATDLTGPSEIAYRSDAATALDALIVRAALTEHPLPPGYARAIEIGADAEFPLRAADLIDRFQGADLGAKLKELEAKWIASGFALDRAALLNEATQNPPRDNPPQMG